MGDLAKAELYVAGAYLVDYSGFFDKHFNSSIIPMRAYQGMNVADAWHDRNLNFDYYNTDIPYGYPGHHGLSTANRAFGAISSPPAESLIMKTWELGEHIVATGSDYYYYPYQDLLNEPYFRYTVKLHDNLIDKDVYLGVVEETRIGRGFDVWKRQAFGIRDNISEANGIDFENNDRAMPWKRCFNFDDYTLARTTCIYRLNINAALYAFEFEGATNPSSQGYCQIVTIPTSMLNFTFKYKNFNNEWVGTDSNIGSYDYFPLYGAASRYTLPDLMYEKPQPKKKGEYKGMPSSNIPLRQTIRTGVDYRHTLDLYDETNYSPKNMFLTNRVGTIDYAQIEFGYDTGRIRCRTELQFTHFVTSSFSDDNRPLVYRVTHYTVLGTDLIEYNYEIDYIKTWFQYHGFTTYNPICDRSTTMNGYEPYITDSALFNGNYEVDRDILSNYAGYNNSTLYIIKTMWGNWYGLNQAAFDEFKEWIVAHVDNKQMRAQILDIFAIPNGTFVGITKSEATSLDFHILEGDQERTVSFTTENSLFVIFPEHTLGSYVQVALTTAFANKAPNFVGAEASVMLHVPYYGDCKLNRSEIIGMSTYAASPRIHYYIDFEGGNIAWQYHDGDYDGQFHDYVPAPHPTISTVDTETVRYIENQQNIAYSSAQVQSLAHIGAGAVGGLMTGNIGGAIGGAVAGGVYSAVNLANMRENNSNEMAHLVANMDYNSVTASGTASMAILQFYFIMVKPILSETLDKYYSVVGYPINKPLLDVGMVAGHCYWLTWNFSVIPELSEIISGFAMASADGIVYNI